jgi:2'-5' RNA ligase
MIDIQHLYDKLWDDATRAYADGQVSTDHHLHNLNADKRAGLSLIAYVDSELHPSMMELVEELYGVAPGQFFYVPQQLHFTVMSLIPVRQKIDLIREAVHLYEATCAEILEGVPAFDVEFCGITASKSAVMIQGWPDAALNHLRDELRKGLSFAGLGDRLDMRYRLVGAHVTLMRYASTPENLPELLDFLHEKRAQQPNFGTMTLRKVAFTKNDYYMLPEKSEALRRFALG